MLASDFSEFEALMRRCEKIFGKKIDDETMQLYFGSLREVPLSTIKRKAEEYLKKAKFFPKPVDLRPKEDPRPERNESNEAAFREAEERTIRTLEEMRQSDPDKWLDYMVRHKGDCNAIRLHKQYGNQLWYDLPQRCWRL